MILLLYNRYSSYLFQQWIATRRTTCSKILYLTVRTEIFCKKKNINITHKQNNNPCHIRQFDHRLTNKNNLPLRYLTRPLLSKWWTTFQEHFPSLLPLKIPKHAPISRLIHYSPPQQHFLPTTCMSQPPSLLTIIIRLLQISRHKQYTQLIIQ